jgi:hypothetical protein
MLYFSDPKSTISALNYFHIKFSSVQCSNPLLPPKMKVKIKLVTKILKTVSITKGWWDGDIGTAANILHPKTMDWRTNGSQHSGLLRKMDCMWQLTVTAHCTHMVHTWTRTPHWEHTVCNQYNGQLHQTLMKYLQHWILTSFHMTDQPRKFHCDQCYGYEVSPFRPDTAKG